ncbi:MAG: hypothetical protein KA715_03105 [Xanthomonadaceae bacterium]|nr:hypothetical protein [Xanthomonadaceae bacterium]
MKLYAFSDLHISTPGDSVYESLCDIIRGLPKPGDTLVFAGDIFDLFIGTVDFFLMINTLSFFSL